MHRPRVIPVLLLRGKGLVKSVKFADCGYVGDPLNAVRIFNEKEVDELVILDIMASKEKRPPDFSVISNLAEECFMPLCYGGGITNIEEMRKIFALGIEKITLNSAALGDLSLVEAAAKEFGSQSIVVSIDCKKNLLGRYVVYSHAKRKVIEKDPCAYARKAQEAGAGEIFINSVDCDGMRMGFDIKLCQSVAGAVNIPVIACGGGGNFEHFRQVIEEGGASAAAGGSFFVYQGKHRAVLISYPKSSEIESIGTGSHHV
ncbi:MAG: AglZ/HisF2 family acetamidino modification protein [Alphaproteobacteria bacterium]|nr:AglZ/HisF2 family acetamidino modification protein [Alphaproteobacteria bacterium]